ncbi:conserved hypothetical protein [Parvibaculum lavamentivorans DS-1]|uniref:Uncharacterized protein n=1 Tax=Parvibaculum lavamentivorans (strain DS-1 / DSM 13023 / NCIMB 13966) TaxID=402881 RepID=A7HQX7_PARL1|nr:hypothetical protein [Parvibaculum lavamentivorans]ABS62310.1 conserved hypothetical protein [Parvibaculum lavamentivorans DS-1]
MPFPTAPCRPLATVSRIRGSAAPALLALVALGLSGCSWFGMGDTTRAGGTAQYPCPSVGVLNETDHVTLVRGAGTDLTDVIAKAEIGRVVSQCSYNVDESTISVDIAFDGVAEIGPAATSREMTFNTFVAVTRRFSTFDKKQVYEVPVTFVPGQRQVRFVKTVEGTVLPYGGDADGRIYQILIGFQLTGEQLAFNRRVPYAPIR